MVFDRLLKEHILFLGSDVNSEIANRLCAQLLLCAGTAGKRYALPHARIMMHQPSGGMGGSASDIKIQAQQSLHIKAVLFQLIAQHTGQELDQVERDADRDRWFTAEQAKDYGFIDHVITSALQAADEGRPARSKD